MSFHSLVCLSMYRELDATVKDATAAPLGVKRSSGSFVRFPTTVMLMSPSAMSTSSAASAFAPALLTTGRVTLVRTIASLRFNWRSVPPPTQAWWSDRARRRCLRPCG